MRDLIVIMPVYNEQGSIRDVILSWEQELRRLQLDYEIHIYNDGSKDATAEILDQLARESQAVKVHHKENEGHGPTILKGYCENCKQAEWLFQVDSDNEIKASYFEKLWKAREEYDLLIGERVHRTCPLSRKFISKASSLVVRLFYGRGIKDVNSPFRLMRTESWKDYFHRIPSDTFAPNVILSGISCRCRLKTRRMDVLFTPRRTGEVSLNKFKLFKAATRSFHQSVFFAFRSF